MNDLSNNVRLSYLYRDAGNYKKYGEVIFTNPEAIDIGNIKQRITSKLIDGEFFIPKEWEIDPLAIDNCFSEMDHEWHEFVDISLTNTSAKEDQSISNLLRLLENNQ